MKYLLMEADSKIAMGFSSPRIYDSSNESFASREMKFAESIKGKYPEPFTIIATEANSYYGKKYSKTDIIEVTSPGDVLCLNEKSKMLFEELELPFEFFEVQIKAKKLEILEGYFLAKLNGHIYDCMDREKSDFVPRRNRIDSLDKLVLDETKIPKGTNVFVIDKFTGLKHWVSESIMKKIKEAGLTGFKFTPSDEYIKM